MSEAIIDTSFSSENIEESILEPSLLDTPVNDNTLENMENNITVDNQSDDEQVIREVYYKLYI